MEGSSFRAATDENVGSFSPERDFIGAYAPYGNVAQLAEHLIVNQRGAGSSPAVSAIGLPAPLGNVSQGRR